MADHELVSTQLPDHDVSEVLSALADVIESVSYTHLTLPTTPYV